MTKTPRKKLVKAMGRKVAAPRRQAAVLTEATRNRG